MIRHNATPGWKSVGILTQLVWNQSTQHSGEWTVHVTLLCREECIYGDILNNEQIVIVKWFNQFIEVDALKIQIVNASHTSSLFVGSKSIWRSHAPKLDSSGGNCQINLKSQRVKGFFGFRPWGWFFRCSTVPSSNGHLMLLHAAKRPSKSNNTNGKMHSFKVLKSNGPFHWVSHFPLVQLLSASQNCYLTTKLRGTGDRLGEHLCVCCSNMPSTINK